MSAVVPYESVEQCRFVAWFRLQYRDVRILAIPNGGKRFGREAQKLRAEGVSPGVPDLYVPAWGLWIEMKRRTGGVLSAAQKDWIEYLRSIGQTVFVCAGAVEARRMITEWRAA